MLAPIQRFQSSKFARPVLIILAVVLGLGILTGLIVLALHFFAPPAPDSSESQPLTFEEIAANPYLAEAKKIFTGISHTADVNGMYGWGEDCTKNLNVYQCQLRLSTARQDEGDRSLYASQNYQAPQIWARYQYYLATRDSEQLAWLEKDLDNYYNLARSGDWSMQSSRFHCLFFEELLASQLFSQSSKDKLLYICNNNDYQRYPWSMLSFDQHAHPSLAFFDPENITVYEPTIIYGDMVAPEERQTYEPGQLLTMIDDLLSAYLTADSVDTGLDDWGQVMAERFMRREIIAAIDLGSHWRLNEKHNPAWSPADVAINELDYLLFTFETLAWYLNAPANYKYADICLLKANLEYYWRTFGTNLTDVQKQTILAKMPVEWSDPYMTYCTFAALALNNHPYDKQLLLQGVSNFNANQGTSDWSKGGFLYPASFDTGAANPGGEFRFEYDVNAILAGLLAKE